MVEKIKFQIGRGGDVSSVFLTSDEARSVIELSNARLSSGRGGSTFGRSRAVQQAVGFIVADAGRRAGTIEKDRLARLIGQERGQTLRPSSFSLGELRIREKGRQQRIRTQIAQEKSRQEVLKRREISIQEKQRQQSLPAITRRPVSSQQRVASSRISQLLKSRAVQNLRDFRQRISKKTFRPLDVVTGGFFTDSKLNKQTVELNRRIDNFNNIFQGRDELFEDEFSIAEQQSKELNKQIEELQKDKEVFDKSLRKSIGDTILRAKVEGTPETLSAIIKDETSKIKKQELSLKQLEGKKGLINKSKRLNIKKNIKVSENRISDAEKGFVPLLKFTFPLPIGGIKGAGKITNVKFIATRRTAGGNIKTDLVFQVGKRDIGKATGVTLSKDGKDITVTVGKFVGKIKKGKFKPLKIKKQKKFRGIDVGKAKPTTLKIKTTGEIKLTKTSKISREVSRQKQNLRSRIIKLKKEFSQFKGIKILKARKTKLAKKKLLRQSSKIRRRNIIRSRIINLNKQLSQLKRTGKISKRIKRIKEGKKLLKGDIQIRKQKISKSLQRLQNRFKQEIRESKFIKTKKEIKELNKFLKGDIKIRKQRLSKKISQLKSQFKGTKILKRIKEGKKLLKGDIQIRKQKISKSLQRLQKRFTNTKRAEKSALKRLRRQLLKDSKLTRRRNISKQRIDKLKQILSEFKVVKRVRRIKTRLPKKPSGIRFQFIRNIKKITQVSKGKVLVKKGKTFSIDDLISKADVFTDKDLELIVGKTLTSRGDLIKFKGIIRGSADVGELSSSQKLAFKTGLEKIINVIGSQSSASKVQGLSKSALTSIGVSSRSVPGVTKQIVSTRTSVSTSIPKVRVVQNLKTGKVRFTIPKQRVATIQRNIQRQISKQGVSTKQKQLSKQKVEQQVKQKVEQKVTQQVRLALRQKLRQTSKQSLRQKLKSSLRRTISPIRVKLPIRILIPPPFLRERKRGPTKKKKKRQQSFDVFARPIKRFKKQKRPKLIKINKVPLSRTRAKDLRNFVTDTSLSRTARIKPTKGKPKNPKLKIPRGYAKKTSGKFRRFRQVKGKRKALPKGRVIEKGKHLLDTRGEKRGITLRRRIAQLNRPLKKKKASVKKIITRRKGLSQAQLSALAEGRKKLLQQRRR